MALNLQSSTALLNNPALLAQYWQERAAADAAEQAAPRNRTVGEVAGDFGTQLLQGAVGLGQAAYGVGNMATLGLLDRATGMSKNFNETNQILEGWKSAQTQAAKAQGSAAFDEGIGAGIKAYVTNPLLMQDLLATNLPSLIPAGAGAQFAMRNAVGAEAIAKYAARGASRAGALQAGGAADIDTINAAREAGMTETEAQLAGLGAGVVTGGMTSAVSKLTGAANLEGMVAAKLMGHQNPINVAGQTVVKAVLGGALKESGDETIQSGAETAIRNAFTGKDITAGVAQSAALGGIAGGVLGGGMGAYAGPRSASPQRDEIAAALAENAAAAGAPAPTGGALTVVAPATTAVATGMEGVRPVEGEVVPPMIGGRPALPAPPLPALPAPPAVVTNAPGTLYVSPNGDALTVDQLAQQVNGGQNPTLDLFGNPVQWDKVAAGTTEETAGTTEAGIPAPGAQGELFAGFSPLQDQIDALTQSPGAGVTPMNFGQAQAARRRQRAENVQSAIARTQEALAESSAMTVPVQQAIDAQIAAQQAGVDPKNILSIEDIVRERMFTTNEDGTLTKWNPDLQRQEEVTPAQADAEVKAATSWKEFMVKQLGLKPNDLQGKAWKAFNDAANESGVPPASAEAANFLNAYANSIDPSADLPKFALKFHEKFGVQPEPIAETEPVAAVTPEPVAEPAPAPAAEETFDTPTFKMGRQDMDVHTATREGVTVEFHKNLETDRWEFTDPTTGKGSSFNAPTRASAKEHIVQVLEDATKAPAPNEDWAAGARPEAGTTTLVSPAAIADNVTKQLLPLKSPKAKGIKLVSIADEMFDTLSDPDALDEAFIALKNTPEYAAASDETKNIIAGSFDLAYEGLTGNKFSRAKTESGKAVHEVVTPQHLERVKKVVDFANASRTKTESTVQMFSTVDEFVASRPLGENGKPMRVPADAKGVYMADGTVALIAENLADDKDAARTLVHERTHEGLSGLLGENIAAVTNRLWANAAMRKTIKEKMEKFGLDRATAAEEVLADMQESGKRLTGDVFSKIKSGITKVFDVLLGSNEIVVSNSDVDALLNDVVRYRTKGISALTSRMAVPEAMSHIDAMLGGVPDKLATARFSRAMEELSALTGESDAPPIDNVSSVIGGAAKDTASYVGGLVAALKKGHIGTLPRELYRFVGVPQLHATFRQLWNNKADDGTTTNSYDSFAKNHAAHAAERNRLLEGVGTVSRDLEALRTKSPEKAKKLGTMIQYSTFYQLYPGAAEQPVAQGIDPVEREQARAKLDSLWKQVGKDGQKLFNDVQTAYNTAFETRYEAIKQTMADAKGVDLTAEGTAELEAFKKEFGDLIESQIRRIGHAPYSPLKRFGNFMVDIRDASGKQVEFTGHDTEADALKFAADQRARYGSEFKVSTTLRSEFQFTLDGLNHEMINKIKHGVLAMYPESVVDPATTPEQQQKVLDRNLRNAEMRVSVEEVLLDAYLHSIPQHSLMQGANARKYVAGFPLDASRAFNSYMVSYAGNVANIKYNGAISKDLADMAAFVRQKGAGNDEGVSMMNVLNAVRGQYEGSRKVEFSPVAEKLTMASFVYMMTSPSHMFLNALQTPMVAAPRMAAQFGIGKALKMLGDSARQYFRPGGVLGDPRMDPNVRAVLEELHKTGMEAFTLASTMSGLAEGKDSDTHALWRTMLKGATYFMQKSEVFNRQITAHAFATMEAERATKAGEALNQDELLRRTKDFIDNQSHFNYDPQNAPEIMQGPWRKAILQFQNYRLNMLALLARDIKTAEFGRLLTGKDALDPESAKLARTTLAYTVGTQLALTGAAGTVVSPVIFAILDAFRDDDDLLDSRTDLIRGGGQLLAHGLLSVLPGIDPLRVEAGSVIPFLGDRQYAPKDATVKEEFAYQLKRVVGPSGGLVENVWTGAAALWDGDYDTAIRKGMPKPLADVYSAVADYDGVRDKQGGKYYDPSLHDSVMTALGLKASGRLEADEKRSAVFQAEKHVSALAKRALTKVALGYNLGDEELQREGTEKFMQLAQAHPEMVKPGMLRRTIVGAAKSQYNADTHGVGQAGRLSQEVLEAVGD